MKIHEFYESVSDSLEYNELEARELESVSRIFASNSFKFIQKIQKISTLNISRIDGRHFDTER